jgi:hypothetical protein
MNWTATRIALVVAAILLAFVPFWARGYNPSHSASVLP